MTSECNIGSVNDNRAIQTLFLGASVMSFNVNMGWGGQPSSLKVDLVNDFMSGCDIDPQGNLKEPPPLFKRRNYPENHYYDCQGNDCYIDEYGDPYNPQKIPAPRSKGYPGKLYFKYGQNNRLVSDYWYDADPGFFGDRTQIDTSKVYKTNNWTSYDIIGTPVYFGYDKFFFGGIVQSWEKTLRDNTPVYSVNIESIDSILDNSWIILKDYGGSIFGKFSGDPYGAPCNFIRSDLGIQYKGKLSQGNIHNVFNVYGFLESFGLSSFGGAKVTDEGIPYTSVLDALSILTSCTEVEQLDNLTKRPFSPFGRILSKTIQEHGTLNRPLGLDFGSVQPVRDDFGIERCFFALDLSELPKPSVGFKLNSDVMSIMEFIRALTAETGKDFFTTLIPGTDGKNNPINIIKIRVVDRNVQPAFNQIPKTISDLANKGVDVKIDNIGQEYNSGGANRILYIGGKQERLYQAKNYRLSYKQTSYVYNPSIDRLVNFYQPDSGKIRPFSYLSTKNLELTNLAIGPFYTEMFGQSEVIHRKLNRLAGWERPDIGWVDRQVGAGTSEQVRHGNYKSSINLKGFAAEGPADFTGNRNRYLPIFMDTICPFFGYVGDTNFSATDNSGVNSFRKIRPVWFDTWTGQLVVVVSVDEIPEVSLGSSSFARTKKLTSIFPNGVFAITETEIRAAMAGFDSYLTYCFAKSSVNKPQLFSMLASAYYLNNPLLYKGGWKNRNTNPTASRWLPPGNTYQHQINVANMSGQPGRARSSTVHNINWDYFVDNYFIKDLMLLCNFIADIGNKYYGQKYMVRLGELAAYRDVSSSALTYISNKTFGDEKSLNDLFKNVIPANPRTTDWIAVFSGSGKLYFSEETSDSAWEEYGNVIDDTIVVGGQQWSALINEQGKIPPILGYNASDQYDYEAIRMCRLSQLSQGLNAGAVILKAYFQSTPISVRDFGLTDVNKNLYAFWAGLLPSANNFSMNKYNYSTADYMRAVLLSFGGQNCNPTKLICPSINTSSLNSSDYVISYTLSSRYDAFGATITAGIPTPTFRPPILNPDLTLTPIENPYGMSKKLYLKATTEGIGFLDIINLKQPRAILSSPGLKLAPSSLTFSTDPTRTVLCNAALEDLILYLKSTPANSPNYSADYVNALLFQIRGYDVWSEFPLNFNNSPNGGIRGTPPAVLIPNGSYNTNVSNQHAMLVEKAAHPFFAGVPVKSNQFSYGPWTNYAAFEIANKFIPGLRTQQSNYRSELNLLNKEKNELDKLIAQKRKELASSQTPPNIVINILRPFFESLVDLQKRIKALNDLIRKALSGLSKFSLPNPDALENMIGGVKVEINSDLVPWNYGGSAYLDQAVLFLINSNVDYQNILESAQITIASTPILGIGSEFSIYSQPPAEFDFIWSNEPYKNDILTYKYKDVKQSVSSSLPAIPIVGNPVYLPPDNISTTVTNIEYKVLSLKNLVRTGTAPVITNMSVKFDNNGFSTTYSFKTYARKIGLFAKEAADRLKRQASDKIANNRLIFGLQNNLNNQKQTSNQQSVSDNEGWSADQLSTKLFGSSPNEVLVGSAENFLPSPFGIRAQLRQNHQAIQQNGALTQILDRGNDQIWSLGSRDPGDLDVSLSDPVSYSTKQRNRAWVGLFEHWETKKELEEGYNQKSAMSLDGIFSPVSFYPTPGNTTYSLLGYPRLLCPACQGDGMINDIVMGGVKSYACPLCSKGAPTYLYNDNINGNASGVNALNLQPVVVPYQPFRNFHAQPVTSGERQKHSIRVVGRNSLPPFSNATSMSLDVEKNKEIRVDVSTNQIVEDGSGFSPDFFIADVARAHLDGTIHLNNHRFFALRGPLMMHGWGYDISGFPVPNAADEPAEYIDGRPKRFIKTEFGLNDLTKQGEFVAGRTPYGLGDVIGKGWTFEGGKWVRKPSDKFYLNWAERPDLWPVGPIDLRWDYDKGVWVGGGKGGCTGNDLPPYIIASGNDPSLLLQFNTLPKTECAYKMIYITLEEDLIKEEYNDETFAVRGFIDDIAYSTAALPNNVRRLVFIRDRAGYTAPRGAKLLCRYDGQYGFYEPVSKQNYFVFGIIRSGNNATIDLEYIQGKYRGSRVPTINIRFVNRFSYDVTSGDKGMFYFENGRWILISIRSLLSGGSPGG